MLVDPPIEKLLPQVENRYTLAIAVARRTRQLVDGGQPLVEESDNPSLVTLACKELAAKKITIMPGRYEPYIPLRPEVSAALANAQREEEEPDDSMQMRMVPQEEEPEPVPVSKIRIMEPNEMFFMPYEMDEDEDEDEEEIEDEDEEDEDVVEHIKTPRDFLPQDDDSMIDDVDLESIDGSIDDFKDEDEDEDL